MRVHQRDAAAAADKVTYLVGLQAAGRGDAQWWLTAEQSSAWRAVGIVSQQILAGSRPLRSGQSAVQSIKSQAVCSWQAMPMSGEWGSPPWHS